MSDAKPKKEVKSYAQKKIENENLEDRRRKEAVMKNKFILGLQC